jgi:5-methylcytosine-specific restriction endonuclease McrA
MSTSVLLLNSDYMPLNVTSLERAVRLLFAGKAEVVHNHDRLIGCQTFEMKLPSIIRMLYYIKRGRKRVALTKKNVLLRDNYLCAYCAEPIPHHLATVDHVLPKARGGKSTWENLVAACQRCNNRKGDRRLEDCGMTLRRRPKEPSHIPFLIVRRHTGDDEWAKYLSHYNVSIEERIG